MTPLITMTLPSASFVAVWPECLENIGPTDVQAPVAGSKISAVDWEVARAVAQAHDGSW